MKRSAINAIIRDAEDFLARMNFRLPPFAAWSPDDWRAKGPECREIVTHQLGWDITDFGSGDYARVGLFLFTIRNGTVTALKTGQGKTYAEKIMIVQERQITPTHTHHQKMEDIIVRGGGALVVQLWNSAPGGGLVQTPVTVSCDGVERQVPAGGQVTLQAGESITLPPGQYHQFWGAPGRGPVLVGEVSRVNDDHTDNDFIDPVGRFPAIVEDESPRHLLIGDYPRFYRHA